MEPGSIWKWSSKVLPTTCLSDCLSIKGTLDHHAKALKLRILSVENQTICIQAEPGSEPCGLHPVDHRGDFLSPTRVTWEITQNNPGIIHALRIRARRILISRLHSSRLDAERVDDIDCKSIVANKGKSAGEGPPGAYSGSRQVEWKLRPCDWSNAGIVHDLDEFLRLHETDGEAKLVAQPKTSGALSAFLDFVEEKTDVQITLVYEAGLSPPPNFQSNMWKKEVTPGLQGHNVVFRQVWVRYIGAEVAKNLNSSRLTL